MKVFGPGYTRGKPIPFRPDGTSCDSCNQEARHLVITEADSYGAEATHMCSDHYVAFMRAVEEQRAELNMCDVCHRVTRDVRPFRDPDEGQNGPVRDTCPECRRRILENFVGDDFDETPTLDDDYLPEDERDVDDDYLPEDDTYETPL